MKFFPFGPSSTAFQAGGPAPCSHPQVSIPGGMQSSATEPASAPLRCSKWPPQQSRLTVCLSKPARPLQHSFSSVNITGVPPLGDAFTPVELRDSPLPSHGSTLLLGSCRVMGRARAPGFGRLCGTSLSCQRFWVRPTAGSRLYKQQQMQTLLARIAS